MSKHKLIEQLGSRRTDWPAWLAGLQTEAADALTQTGLPHKKVERWRFTPLRPLTSGEFVRAGAEPDTGSWRHVLDEQLGDIGDSWIIPMVDGAVLAAPKPAPAGVRVSRLRDAIAARPALMEQYLGRIAPAQHFAALNAALFADGLVIEIDAGAVIDKPIHIVSLAASGSDDTVCYPRALVIAQPRAQVQLIETHLAAAPSARSLANPVTEVAVGDGAHVDHVRVHMGSERSYNVGMLAARVGRDGVYRSRLAAFGGTLTRVDVQIDLADLGAETSVDGIYHAGRGEHVDFSLRIDHKAPRCTSNINYRGILDANGEAVWDGMTVVHRGAQHTVAHQQNRNLLLSDDASVNTKPHLEIDTDDLVASHGATVGSLDDQQLFYLRSRGLEHDQARAALTYAFVQELLDGVGPQVLRGRLGALLRERLPAGDTIGEICHE